MDNGHKWVVSGCCRWFDPNTAFIRFKGLVSVKFQQGTWPFNSNIRLDEMASNSIKMG